MNIGRRIEYTLRYPVGFVCAYEAFAIFTRRVPTISEMCWRNNVFTPIILGGLAAHLVLHKIEAVLE